MEKIADIYYSLLEKTRKIIPLIAESIYLITIVPLSSLVAGTQISPIIDLIKYWGKILII